MADLDTLMAFGSWFSLLTSISVVGLYIYDTYFSTAVTFPSLQVTESQVVNLTADLGNKVALAGSTMTGPLILSADPATALGAATKQYVDAGVGKSLISSKTVEAYSAILDAVAAGQYVGCSAISTLGTVTTGVWNGSVIPVAYGGTGTATPALVSGTNITVSGAWPAQTVSVSGIIAPANGGTGMNNGASLLTLGGNLTTSGAFAITLTATAATSVTLPTSGTLVNSAVTALTSLTSVGTLANLVVSGSSISPSAVNLVSLGTAAVPFVKLNLGSSATDSVAISSAGMAASRSMAIPDPLVSSSNIMVSSQSAKTQLTSISTAVTVTGPSAQITTVALTTAASSAAGSFVVTNTFYTSATQLINVSVTNGTNTAGCPVALVSATAPGSNQFTIKLQNVDTAVALNGTVIVNVLIC